MFIYNYVSNGWFYFDYFDGKNTFFIEASQSFDKDPVIELLKTVVKINLEDEAIFKADEEGTEYCFRFVKKLVDIEICLICNDINVSPIHRNTVSLKSLNSNILDFYKNIWNSYDSDENSIKQLKDNYEILNSINEKI